MEQKPIAENPPCGIITFHAENSRCRACHRPLHDPSSIRRGVGPVCWEHGGGERWQIMLEFGDKK